LIQRLLGQLVQRVQRQNMQLFAQQLAQLIERLAQVLLGSLVRLIRPEQRGQRLAGVRLRRLKRQEGQQGLEPGGTKIQGLVIDRSLKGTQESECKTCH
jgi:hypothetical protein